MSSAAFRPGGRVLGQGVLTTSFAIIAGPVPAGSSVRLAAVIFTGVASASTVSYGVGKSGSTPGTDATLQGKGIPIGASGDLTSTIDCTELSEILLGPGDYVTAKAGNAASVSYLVSGEVL